MTALVPLATLGYSGGHRHRIGVGEEWLGVEAWKGRGKSLMG